MASNVLELWRPDGPLPTGNALYDLAIREPADIASAAETLAREAGRHGLRLMTWHNLATMEPMVDDAGDPLNLAVFGWEHDSLAPWLSMEVVVTSPLLKVCRIASEPIWINRGGVYPQGRNQFVDRIDLAGFEELAAAKAAIVMPIRLPFGALGAAILTSIDPAKDDLSAEFAAFTRFMAVPVHKFVRDYAQRAFDERYLPASCLLTAREIECLNWVAQGKTDFEISIILGCSHAGVRYHLTRVCAKLGAVNRAQSVFRACQLGYLGVPSRPICTTAVPAGQRLPAATAAEAH